MSAGAIITVILGSSFLGAVLTNLAAWGLRRAERSREANYLSLSLAHVFEAFAYSCVSLAEEQDAAESSGGHIGGYVTKLPSFPGLPDSNYRSIDLDILDQVFDFPQRVNFAQESLTTTFDVLDGEDAVKEGYASCLKLAKESLTIGHNIRSRYGLRHRSLTFGSYSVRERLEQKQKTLEE